MRRLRATIMTVAAILGVYALLPGGASAQGPALQVREAGTGTPVTEYRYLVNVDNTALPSAADPFERPGFNPDPSNSPVAHTGTVTPDDTADATLPALSAGRYLITVRAPGYKLWGRHVTLPATGPIVIELSSDQVPAADLVVHVFGDDQSVNAAPDLPLETGLEGFDVIVEDSVGQVTVEADGETPLCGGQCLTDAEGNVTIRNLPPGKYEVQAIPPDGEGWIQTSTYEGKFPVGAFLEEGSNGRGPEAEALIGPPGTFHWFGFVKEQAFEPGPDTGSITGTARTWVAWPPGITPAFAQEIEEPYIALSDLGNDDQQVFVGRGNVDGTFEIPDVPPGTYQLSIWDLNLDYVIRLVTVEVGPGEALDLGDVGVFRWFGFEFGFVFNDDGAGPGGIAGDGIRQPGEPGIRGMDVAERWRDGSVKAGTFTDNAGRWQFTEALFGPISKFGILEVGFPRFARTGMSVMDHTGEMQPLPDDVGGGLLAAQLTQFGHSSTIDFGKRPYEEGENGGISGVIQYGTTRNEVDARLQAAEPYEPGIAGVTVRLYSRGEDGEPNSDDDVLLNEVESDSWQYPSGCDVRDVFGNLIPALAFAGDRCMEYLSVGNETKDGAFDGGYAIETMCPPDPDTGESTVPCDEADEVPLDPGDYVVEAVSPDGYQVVKEEDVNTSEGDTVVPAVPPPPCVGDLHLVEDPDSPFDGQEMPLCDKRLVTLEDRQNAASDFFLFTDNEVPIPGRIVGVVLNDVQFEQDPSNPLFGEGEGEKVPIGVYDYADRRITTVDSDENGAYEVLLPSTYTASCPTPSGVCPGMYKLVVNDPGTKADPNPSYNPNVIGQTVSLDVWPGKTTYADTPVIPRNAQTCNDFTGPEIFQVTRVHMPTNATGANRTFRILGRNFGTSPTVSLGPLQNLTVTGNTTTSTGAQQLTVSVPTTLPFQLAGPRQLQITAGGRTTRTGITFHITGTGYNPTVRTVGGPAGSPNPAPSIQAAINATARTGNTLIDVFPGNYRDNVVLDRRVKLQGHGPGGFVNTDGPPNAPAEDPLQLTPGSVIDGRYFIENEAAWDGTVTAARPFAGHQSPPGGAAVTVLARTGAFTSGFPAAVDGFGITLGDGGGAGGIHVNGHASFLRITNNVIAANAGEFAGAIALGLPQVNNGVADNNNDSVTIRFNRILSNGGRNKAGAIGIYNGAEGYAIADNDICANSSFEYGGGISHHGRSPNGTITDNRIMFNSAFDEGGGILVGGELGIGGPNGNGSGRVDIERNLIEQNLSNDDGGGIQVLNALTFRVEIRTNLLVNNVATDAGGGVSIDDSSNVRVINNTVARNRTTATAEDSDGHPHGAGLVAHPFTAAFQSTLPAGSPTFPNPVMFNNIFWENRAFTYDPTLPAEDQLVDQGVIDLEVIHPGTPSAFSPRWSLLTQQYGTPHPSNRIGENPLFVNPFETIVRVLPGATVGPVGATQVLIEPPDVPPDVPGDYHIQAASPAIDRGVRCSNTPFPAPLTALSACTGSAVEAPSGLGADIDRQYRPQLRTLRVLTPWDLGADELTGVPVVLP
jgi:parallel beta-helix repeat protein